MFDDDATVTISPLQLVELLTECNPRAAAVAQLSADYEAGMAARTGDRRRTVRIATVTCAELTGQAERDALAEMIPIASDDELEDFRAIPEVDDSEALTERIEVQS